VSIVVTNIGSSTTVVGGVVTITIGAGGVPAGAHTVVAVSWNSTVTQPTVADTAGNTYLIGGGGSVQANNNVAANGAGGVFRQRTGLALVNGNTITVTLGGTATLAAVDAFYVTGLLNAGSDSTGTYNVAFGSSTTPSVTSGVPVRQGELFVAIVTGATLISSFTQDTTNAAWGTSAPAGSISNAAPVLGVGFVVNTGTGTLTYAPTFGTSDAWAATVVGYLAIPAWGFDSSSAGGTDVPRSASVLRSRAAATKGRSEFAVFSPFVPMGWEVQSVQPPHPVQEKRAAAVMHGDDGNEAQQINFVPIGWPVQPVQPPHPRPERFGAVARGDDGIVATFQQWRNAGWELQPYQPPHPRPERVGAILVGEQGTEAPLAKVQPPSGWELVQAFTAHPRPERAGAVARGDEGIYATLINWRVDGWPVQMPQPPHPRPERTGATAKGDDGIENLFPSFVGGWEFQQAQLRTVQIQRSGLEGFVQFSSFSLLPYAIDQNYMLRNTIPKVDLSYKDDGAYDALRSWLSGGWTPQLHDLPHPRPERGAAIEVVRTGADSPFIFVPVQPQFGWELFTQSFTAHPRPERVGAVARGDDGAQFPFAVFYPAGWPVQPFQPPHPAPERRAAAVLRGDEGDQSPFQVFYPIGWPVQHFQPPHPRPERVGATLVGDTGIEAQAILFTIPLLNGWDYVTQAYTAHLKPERSGAVARGDDGTQAPFIIPFIEGWAVQPPQPPHPRPERAGAIFVGEQGTEQPYAFGAFPSGWDYVIQSYTTHPRPERSGAVTRGDDGTQATLAVFHPAGWPVQPVQPSHPRPERSGAVARGEEGIEAPLTSSPSWGWFVEPTQPPHPISERRIGATARGEGGIQSPTIQQLVTGWEYQHVQPPHPRTERTGAVLIGEIGTEARLTLLAPWGWEASPFYPSHPRPERSGAVARGEEGIEAAYVPPVFVPLSAWWESSPFLLRYRSTAARYDTNVTSVWGPVTVTITLTIGNRGQIYSALSGGMETIGGF